MAFGYLTEAQMLALFQNGSDLYKTTSAHTGNWHAIAVLSAATFTTLTDAKRGGNTFTGAVPAGMTIYGRFTAITLASGRVLAYRAV